jgi:superfamily II DNA or RNA helicase
VNLFNNQAEIQGKFEVVYDLAPFVEGLILPTAYIVSLDQENLLAHVKMRAMEKTIGSFNIPHNETQARLFFLMEELEPKNLEKKFNPPKKKPKPLDQLWADKELQPKINTFVQQKLDQTLTLINENRLHLTWSLARQVLVKDFLMETHAQPLEPHLYFKRSPQEVKYRLLLSEGEENPWRIGSRDVVPITNTPGWVFVDYHLYRLAEINGNMVKPFQKRDEVTIPAASVKQYFEAFILKVASKVDIDAEGFEMRIEDQLQSCELSLLLHPYTNNIMLNAVMKYPGAEFKWKDYKEKKTKLDFGDDIRILQVRRDFTSEKKWIARLDALGLQPDDLGYFSPAEPNEDPFYLNEWFNSQQSNLQAAGFLIKPFDLQDMPIYPHPASLRLYSERINDWFDIYGVVLIGEFEIPFVRFARNIREGNRFFRLPNEQFFIIPLEWMEKYRLLMQFGKAERDSIILKKNQYTLLDGLGIEQKGGSEEHVDVANYLPDKLLKADLRPYQLEGLRWLIKLYHNRLGACLADDMGLGKTLQTIALLLYAKAQKAKNASEVAEKEAPAAPIPQLDLFSAAADEDFLKPLSALVILPASLVFNWEAELQKFAPSLTAYKHVGPKRYEDIRLLRRFDVILTTYQTALRDEDLLSQLEAEYIILDESQQIKNRESKVFKVINGLKGKHKISLSGTPIENSLSDLWSQMQFINSGLLGNFAFFKREFVTPIEKYQDEDRKSRLRGLVSPYLLRRTKEEVAKDLPPLSTQIFYSEMTPEQAKLYEREKSAARNYLLENFAANSPQYRILVLQSLTKLRQIANHPRLVSEEFPDESGKFNDILEQWETIRRSNHKALFFSSFVQYLHLFSDNFKQIQLPHSILTGDMVATKRKAEIEKFEQDPNVQSFLISIKAGGTGLNLTAADYVFILDPWWNPTTENQAIARAHRIGQEKSVIAVKFITRGSIEEKILKLQGHKSKLAEDIIENVGKEQYSREDIEFLLT